MSQPLMVFEVGSPAAEDFHLPFPPLLPPPELELPLFLPSVLGLNLGHARLLARWSGLPHLKHLQPSLVPSFLDLERDSCCLTLDSWEVILSSFACIALSLSPAVEPPHVTSATYT